MIILAVYLQQLQDVVASLWGKTILTFTIALMHLRGVSMTCWGPLASLVY
jgi:hypothetical protein